MGELAEDMIEGRCCEACGMYFADPDDEDACYEHGFPVTCKDCWDALTPKERRRRQRASVSTL